METKEAEKKEAKYLEEIRIILGSEYTDKSIVGLNIVKLLSEIPNQKDQVDVIEEAITKLGEVPKTGEMLRGEPLSDEIWEKLSEENYEYIIAVFNRLTYKRPSTRELAQGIKKLLDEFDEIEGKIFAIIAILQNKQIPYVQIPKGGQYVSKKRLLALYDSLKEETKLLRAIQNSKLKNETQMASLMLGIVNSGKNDEEKAVLMTVALGLEFTRGYNKAKEE